MIARLAISPEALVEASSATGRAAKQDHERLLKLVIKHGAVVFPDEDAAKAFLTFLREQGDALPPGVANRWMELLRSFLKGSRMWAERPPLVPSLGPSARLATLGETWAGAVDVVVVDVATGSSMGIPEADGWLVEGRSGLEFAYPDAVPSCETVSRIDQVHEAGNFPEGTSRELFWDQVLLPLWRTSKHVTLVDRYLLEGWWDGSAVAHVEWLLEHLAGAPGVRGGVTLIAEAKKPEEAHLVAVLDHLSHFCSGGRIDRLQVHLVPRRPHREARMSHDRHIRFDTSAVSLGASFDRLSTPMIRDHEGVNWSYRWADEALRSFRSAERRATNLRGAVTAERGI